MEPPDPSLGFSLFFAPNLGSLALGFEGSVSILQSLVPLLTLPFYLLLCSYLWFQPQSPSVTNRRLELLLSFTLQTFDPVRVLTPWLQPPSLVLATPALLPLASPSSQPSCLDFAHSFQPNSSFICQVLVLVKPPAQLSPFMPVRASHPLPSPSQTNTPLTLPPIHASQTASSSTQPWLNHCDSVQPLFSVHASLIPIFQSPVSLVSSR